MRSYLRWLPSLIHFWHGRHWTSHSFAINTRGSLFKNARRSSSFRRGVRSGVAATDAWSSPLSPPSDSLEDGGRSQLKWCDGEENKHLHSFSSLTLLDVSRPFVHRILQLAAHADPPVAPFTKYPGRFQFTTVRLFSQVLDSLFFCSSDPSYRFRNGFIVVCRFCGRRCTPVNNDSVE